MPVPVFNEALHRYTTPGGEPLPGVTSVLGGFQRVRIGRGSYYITLEGQAIDADTIDEAARFGTAAHKVAEFTFKHGVGSFEYPEAMTSIVEQVNRFVEDHNPEVLHTEQCLYCPTMKYAGTFDLFCKIKGRLCLIDVKTGTAGKLAAPQLAAYEHLIRLEYGYKQLIDRYTLRLSKTGGGYKLEKHTRPDDWTMFQASLARYNYLNSI